MEAKVQYLADGKTKYYHDSSNRSKCRVVEHVMGEKEVAQWEADAINMSRQ